MAAGKHHGGNNQSGNPPKLHRGIDGRGSIEQWGFSVCDLHAGLNQATVLMRRNDGIPQDTYMTYLQQLGLAQVHRPDYARRNQDGVRTALCKATPSFRLKVFADSALYPVGSADTS